MENQTAIYNNQLTEEFNWSAIYNPELVDGTDLDMSTISFEEELVTGIYKRKREEESELMTAIYSSPVLKRTRSDGSGLILTGEFDDEDDSF